MPASINQTRYELIRKKIFISEKGVSALKKALPECRILSFWTFSSPMLAGYRAELWNLSRFWKFLLPWFASLLCFAFLPFFVWAKLNRGPQAVVLPLASTPSSKVWNWKQFPLKKRFSSSRSKNLRSQKTLEQSQFEMELAELKHGRLAMLAITAFVFQEVARKVPVVEETPQYF